MEEHGYASSSENLKTSSLSHYQLYEERGGEDGHDMEDWLRAEDEITRRSARAAA